jgi:hypothetical protein
VPNADLETPASKVGHKCLNLLFDVIGRIGEPQWARAPENSEHAPGYIMIDQVGGYPLMHELKPGRLLESATIKVFIKRGNRGISAYVRARQVSVSPCAVSQDFFSGELSIVI